MAAMSDYLENEILDHILRGEAWTPPTSVFCGAYTDSTGLESNSPSGEVSGGSYARVEIGGASGNDFSIAAAGATDNDNDITFVTATGVWGLITNVALNDASSAGNVLIHAALQASRQINANDQFVIPAGDFDITID